MTENSIWLAEQNIQIACTDFDVLGMYATGNKSHRAHPADAAAAAAAGKAQVARPASAVRSQNNLTSPVRTTDVSRQGSKVADISRQFSQTSDLSRQGSAADNIPRQSIRNAGISRQSSTATPQKASPMRQVSTAAKSASLINQPLAIPEAATGDTQQKESTVSKDCPAKLIASDNHTHAGESTADPSDYGSHALLGQPESPRLAASTGLPSAEQQQQTSDKPADVLTSTNISSKNAASTDPISIIPTQVHSMSPDATATSQPEHQANSNHVQSTLTAVQQDYLDMVADQEEAKQAQAAAVAVASSSAAETDPFARITGDSGVAGLFEPTYIPALPLNPRASVRRGNHALFQKLAAGQGQDMY